MLIKLSTILKKRLVVRLRVFVRIQVTYKDADEAPITSIDQGIAADAFFDLNHPSQPMKPPPTGFCRGNFEKGLIQAKNTLTGTASTQRQEHFYMETQSAFVIPQDAKIKAYSSCQGPGMVRQVLC